MSMVIKRNHLGQAELCGSGEFVGEFVQGAFVGVGSAAGRAKNEARRAKFKAALGVLMAKGLTKPQAIAQMRANAARVAGWR